MTPREALRQADAEIARAERLLEVAHAAFRMGVCFETIRRWIRSGKVRALKTPGGQWRIPESEVRRLATTDNKAQPVA